MSIFIAVIAFLTTISFVFLTQKSNNPTDQDAGLAQIQEVVSITKDFSATVAPLTPTPILVSRVGKPAIITTGLQKSSPPPAKSTTPSVSVSTPSFSPAPPITPISATTPTVSPSPSLAFVNPTPSSNYYPTATPEPTFSSQPSNTAIDIISLSSPIERGKEAELTIKASVGSSCSLKVTLPSGSISSAQGLAGSKNTDASGIISWRWRIGGSTKPGTAALKITCTNNNYDLEKTTELAITDG